MKPKLIITGALGHIGSRFIYLYSREYDILVVDSLLTQRYASLYRLPHPVGFKQADILHLKRAEWDTLLDGAVAVVHLAALTDAEASFKQPQQYERVNCVGTEQVAEACLRNNIPLLFPSTTSVYGAQRGIITEDYVPHGYKLHSPYAASKRMAELALLGDYAHRGLRFAILRLGTIVGASPGMRFHTIGGKFCWLAAWGLPLTVWDGAWNEKRPYLELTDAVRAMVWVIREQRFNSQVWNVVTGNHTVCEVVEAIKECVPNVSMIVTHSPLLNQLSYEVSADKIQDDGFVFTGSLRQGILSVLLMIGAARDRPGVAWELEHAKVAV